MDLQHAVPTAQACPEGEGGESFIYRALLSLAMDGVAVDVEVSTCTYRRVLAFRPRNLAKALQCMTNSSFK